MISEFGENSYCSFESKETALLHSENDSLQQRVNALTHEVRTPTPSPPHPFKIKERKAANEAQVRSRGLTPQKKNGGSTGAAGRMVTQGHSEVETCFSIFVRTPNTPTSRPDL